MPTSPAVCAPFLLPLVLVPDLPAPPTPANTVHARRLYLLCSKTLQALHGIKGPGIHQVAQADMFSCVNWKHWGIYGSDYAGVFGKLTFFPTPPHPAWSLQTRQRCIFSPLVTGMWRDMQAHEVTKRKHGGCAGVTHLWQLLRVLSCGLPGLHMQLVASPGPRQARCVHGLPLQSASFGHVPGIGGSSAARLPHMQLPHCMPHLQIQALHMPHHTQSINSIL